MSVPDEIKMFAEAGKTRDVPLHVLLAMFPRDVTERIAAKLRLNSFLATAGMHTPDETDAVLVRVAAYMGWVDGWLVPKDGAE